MQEIVNMILVDGDPIATGVNIFVFGFILTFVLGFANIIRDGIRTAK